MEVDKKSDILYLNKCEGYLFDIKKDKIILNAFIVDKKGQLSSFKIEQSLGKVEDAEAIRLIKEGPAWKLIEGKKSRTTVIIQF